MNTKRSLISKAVTLAMTSGLLLHTNAFAQEADTEQVDASKDDKSFEQIVVTSQKRVQSISDVPVAVSVLRGDQIESAFANNVENLQALVPSVSFRKGTTTRNSALTVRGIGTISFSIAAEPSVATVVDGVVLGLSLIHI